MKYEKENRRLQKLTERIETLERENAKLLFEKQRIEHALHGALHEIRRFSSEIVDGAETLSKRLVSKGNENNIELANTIFYTGGMLSARLGLTDIELNPSAALRQPKFKSGIFKKFEKARHVLSTRAKTRRIEIKLHGNSYTEISTLPAFELMPFLILDNALKYSPKGNIIDVYHSEPAPNDWCVRVDSIGPLVGQHELEKIFERGYRGEHSSATGGEGLGLFLAKVLCDFHSISISAECTPEKTASPQLIPLGKFSIHIAPSKG